MALENCFHVTIVCSARAGVLQSCHPFVSKERLYMPTCTGLKASNSKFSMKASSLTHSLNVRCKKFGRIYCKAGETVDEVQAVTESTWNDLVIASGSPVLVDFWAPWCGPCRMIAPFIDELAKEYAGKIKCYKLNTDECPNIATQYGIRSIPTVLFFKDGEKKESIIGAVPKTTLSASVEKYL